MMGWSPSQTKVAIGIVFSWFLCCSLHAQTTLPHTFSNGSPADADQVNENFELLLSGLNVLENFTDVSEYGIYSVIVDCSADPMLLQDALEATKHLSKVNISIKGICELPRILRVWSEYLSISGDCESGETALVSAAPLSGNANFTVWYGGTLLLRCLQLGTSESAGSLVWTDQGSHVQLSNVTVRGDGLTVANTGKSTVILTGKMEGIKEVQVRSAHLRVQAPQEGINIPVLFLRDGSTVVCVFCYGQIGWLGLTTGSSASLQQSNFEDFGGELTIGDLVLRGKSKLIIEHRGESTSISPVTITNESKDEGSVIESTEYIGPPFQID